MSHQTIVVTPTRWFLRGFLVGVLIFAALNAVSYFFRSDGWGNLLGTHPQLREALGFPLEVWEEGNNYGGYFVDYRALLLDALCAAIGATICAVLVVRGRRLLNRIVKDFEERVAGGSTASFQFSLRGLLLVTLLAALTAALARVFAARPEVLGLIYVLGPWILVLVALLPRGIPWQQRVMILAPAAVLLIVAAIAVGASLEQGLEVDKVLLGIFVCWTPQSVLAATAITLMLIFAHRRRLIHEPH